MALLATPLKVLRVGHGLNAYDETFEPAPIEVEISARPVGEGVPLTEEEIAAINDDKLIHLTNLNLSYDSDENVQEERPVNFRVEAIAK